MLVHALVRVLVLVLVPVHALACSRGTPIDEAPVGPAAATGVPAAASSARLVAPGDTSEAFAAPEAGIVLPFPPSPTPFVAHGNVHDDGPTVTGSGLPSEVIRRIVRQNLARARLCYQNGLRTDPTLAGTVRTRFVIDKSGSAGSVSDAGSTLTDKPTVACVQRMFGYLSFPEPTAGAMTVVYSLSFTPPPP